MAADFLVERNAGDRELVVHNYGQFREEEMLMRPTNLVPGKDFVVIADETTPQRALSQGRAYFAGQHQSPHRIQCWVAGALARRACLKETP